jgi:type I restriction enzyme S subunit
MMTWPEVQFETLFSEPQRNGLYKEKQFHGSGAKIVNMGELFAYRFLGSQDMQRVQISDTEYERFGLQDGDLLFARRSLIESGAGKCVIVEGVKEEMVFESSLIRVRLAQERCSSRFYLYYFSCPPGRSRVETIITGAAQKGIRGTDLARIIVHLPPLTMQQKIAAILSAYDDLIENNLQRIKILEEMAQNLYREWFVRFRFLGHQHARFTDSSLGRIPEGWEVTTLGVQLAALESGKRPKGGIREIEDGVPSIGAENIDGIGRHNFAGEKFIPREFFQEMRKGVVHDRDVAIYKDGAYIGKSSYFRDGFPHSECCVNEHVFLLRANGVRLRQNALYLWLQEPDTVHAIRATNANAAQPGINQQSVGGLELILPDEKTAARFDQLVEPLLAEVINLAKRIQTLRRTRDLLLPRLISGELNVSELDIAVPEEAVT